MSINDTRDGYVIIDESKLTDEEIEKLRQKWAESYEGAVDFASIAVMGENEDDRNDNT